MPERPFSLDHAAAICLSPYLAREQRRETARQAAAEADTRRNAGVCWSGLAAEPSPPPRTPAQIRAAAEAALERARGFAETPRGRFLAALHALAQLGCAAETEAARACFARGFADPDRPACPSEIGAAIAALARLARPEARAACLALCELLHGALGAAAE